MLGDRKRRTVEIHNRVAAFALVVVGRGGKLVAVCIFVAIGAGRKLYLVNRVLASRDVALPAFNLDVFASQGITRSIVFPHSKQGRLPTFQVVAFRALALFRAALKLALVRIRLVAIVAVREWNLLLEVAVHMARHAGNLGVLANQRIFRFGMIKIKSGQHCLPTAGGVAGIAGFLEFPLVRVTMAGSAGVELHISIARRPARRIRLVTLFAGHFRMQAGKRVSSFGMVEIFGGLPVFYIVTLGAFVAELAFVRILVAGLANGREPKIRFGQVLVLD